MDVPFIKKEEPADYDLIDDGVQDIYTITIKEEPTDEWNIGDVATTLQTEDSDENETLYEVEICDDSDQSENGPSNENDGKKAANTFQSKASSKVGRTFPCDLCPAVFKRKYHLKGHLKNHDPDSGKELCNVCNKFIPKPYYKFHALHFHQGPPYQCSTCDRKFEVFNIFRRHLRFMHRDKQYQCGICQKTFATKGNLNSHSETHKERKRKFNCEICGHSFFRNNTLRRHIRNSHPTQPRMKHVCSVCNHAYFRLNDHKCRQPTTKPQKIWNTVHCDKCSAEFRDPFTLVLHTQQNCTSRLMYECEVCALKIPNKNFFRRHFITNHGTNVLKRPKVLNAFECDCCRRIFQVKHSCQRHEASCKLLKDYTDTNGSNHTSSFKCNICGLTFEEKFGIVEHMRIMHSTESLSGERMFKNFTCTMNRENMRFYRCCDDYYVGQEQNPDHTVTDKCEFRCRQCRTVYADRYSLLRHCAEHKTKIHQSLRHMEHCQSCDRMFQWKSSMPKYLRSFS